MSDDLTISILVCDIGLWAWAGVLALARAISAHEAPRRRKR